MEPDAPSSRLQHQQQEHEQSVEQQAQTRAGVAFATTEDLLRHDRAATPLPGKIEDQLKASIAREPEPPRPWWKRWLGK